MSNEKIVVVVFAAKDKARYTRAMNAEDKARATTRTIIGELAKQYFDGPCTVAEFARAAGEDLSMGKGVTAEQKAFRNRRRTAIHDGLKMAGMLKVNQRAAQAQGKRRMAEAVKNGGTVNAADIAEAVKEAQEAVKAAQEAKAPTQRELFEAIASMLDHASPATLRRIANAVSVKLAQAA